nr:copia protein [Tanacetum cinerariifolium]
MEKCNEGESSKFSKDDSPYSNRNVVPTVILTRSRLVSLNAARPVPTIIPQSIVKSPRPVKHVVNKAHTPIRRRINHRPSTTNSNFNKKVTTVMVNKVNVVQGTKGNAEKASANWVWIPKFTVLDHVSRLTSASMTLKTFDYTNAIGISKVPRENNMYNVDLKNVVPSEDLTCLFAKATLDESNLWHRRLGHINFKTMNKLVKFYGMKRIKREFSVARTPQQNRVAERKNKTPIEAARTMLADLLVSAISAPVNATRPNPTNSTNSFNTASSSDTAISPNFGIARKSSFVGPSKYPDDPDMPELEDIVYLDDEEDVCAEADLSNLETNIYLSVLLQLPEGKIDQTLFIKKQTEDILLVQVYVDDIIFGSVNKELFKDLEKLMTDKFQIMGELTFFFGLQVKQKDDRIFISQDKYVGEILRKFGFTDVKSASTPIETEKPLLKDPY